VKELWQTNYNIDYRHSLTTRARLCRSSLPSVRRTPARLACATHESWVHCHLL